MKNSNKAFDPCQFTDFTLNVVLIRENGCTTTFQTGSWTQFAEDVVRMFGEQRQFESPIKKVLASSGECLTEYTLLVLTQDLANGAVHAADVSRVERFRERCSL